MNVEQRSVQVIVCGDAKEASRKVAEIFANAIRANPQLVLGLATGETIAHLNCLLGRRRISRTRDAQGVDWYEQIPESAGYE